MVGSRKGLGEVSPSSSMAEERRLSFGGTSDNSGNMSWQHAIERGDEETSDGGVNGHEEAEEGGEEEEEEDGEMVEEEGEGDGFDREG